MVADLAVATIVVSSQYGHVNSTSCISIQHREQTNQHLTFIVSSINLTSPFFNLHNLSFFWHFKLGHRYSCVEMSTSTVASQAGQVPVNESSETCIICDDLFTTTNRVNKFVSKVMNYFAITLLPKQHPQPLITWAILWQRVYPELSHHNTCPISSVYFQMAEELVPVCTHTWQKTLWAFLHQTEFASSFHKLFHLHIFAFL